MASNTTNIETLTNTVNIGVHDSTTMVNPPPTAFDLAAEGGKSQVVRDLTEGLFEIETVPWAAETRGSTLHSVVLPSALFENEGIPHLSYLRNYTYFHTDLLLRVSVCAPSTTYGTLIASLCFGHAEMKPKERKVRSSRMAVFQQQNGILQACANSVVEFNIPYKYFKSCGLVKDGDNQSDGKSMVTLLLTVNDPLTSTLSSDVTGDVKIEVGFRNLVVSGIVANESSFVKLTNSDSLCLNELATVLRSKASTLPLKSDGDLSIDSLVKKEGFLKDFTWRAGCAKDTQLGSIYVMPYTISEDLLHTEAVVHNLAQYVLPPISVVSSMFRSWRGSLVYRIRVPRCEFISGKLRVSFIPSSTFITSFSLKALKSACHAVFDLNSADYFDFEVPFISDKPVNSTTSYGFTGYLVLSTASRLNSNSVSTMPDLNVTVTVMAGRDFELAVPTQPRIGTGYSLVKTFDSTGIVKDTVYYRTGFLGSSSLVFDNQVLVFKSSLLDTDLTRFNVSAGTIYRARKRLVQTVDQTSRSYEYFVVPPSKDGFTDYLAPIRSRSEFRKDPLNKDNYFVADHSSNYVDLSTLDLFVYEAGNQALAAFGTPSLGVSNHLGETFTSINEVLQRYSLYSLGEFSVLNTTQVGEVLASIPVRPESSVICTDNQDCRRFIRDGPISIISSAYRYFRGEITFKLTFFNYPTNYEIMIFHDVSAQVNVNLIDQPRMLSQDSICCGTDAGITRNLTINNTVDITIPYYKEFDFLTLGTVDYTQDKLDLISSMFNGAIKIVSGSPVVSNFRLKCNVQFALTGSSGYNTFNGFYSMVNCDDVPKMPIPQVGLRHSRSNYIELPNTSVFSQLDLVSTSPATNESFVSRLFGYDTTVEKVDKVLDQVNEVLQGVRDAFGTVDEQVSSLIASLVNNFAHMAFSQNYIGTFIVSFIGVLRELKLINSYTLTDFTTKLQKLAEIFIAAILPRYSNNHPQGSEPGMATNESNSFGVPEEFNDAEVASLFASLVILIGGALGYSFSGSPKVGFFSNNFVRGIKDFSTSVNPLITFFKTSMSAFMKIVDYIRLKMSQTPEDRAILSLDSNHKALQTWYAKAINLLDPSNKMNVKRSPTLIAEVYMAQAFGQAVSNVLIGGNSIGLGTVASIVRDINNKLYEFVDELTSECLSPAVRFEPFFLHITGGPGVGKSFISKRLAIDALDSIDVKSINPIFTRTSGTQYWNGLCTQEVIYFDDLGQVKTPEANAIMIQDIFNLKTNVPFNPSIAEISNKKLRPNPFLLLAASNTPFYNHLSSSMISISAFHRRRDMLVDVRVKKEYANENGGYSIAKMEGKEELRKNYGHLEFYIYGNSIDSTQENDVKQKKVDYVDYTEFKQILQTKFREYYNREVQNFRSSLEMLREIAPEEAIATTPSYCEFATDYLDSLSAIVRARYEESTRDTVLNPTLGAENSYSPTSNLEYIRKRYNASTPGAEASNEADDEDIFFEAETIPKAFALDEWPELEGTDITFLEERKRVGLAFHQMVLADKQRKPHLTNGGRNYHMYMFDVARSSGSNIFGGRLLEQALPGDFSFVNETQYKKGMERFIMHLQLQAMEYYTCMDDNIDKKCPHYRMMLLGIEKFNYDSVNKRFVGSSLYSFVDPLDKFFSACPCDFDTLDGTCALRDEYYLAEFLSVRMPATRCYLPSENCLTMLDPITANAWLTLSISTTWLPTPFIVQVLLRGSRPSRPEDLAGLRARTHVRHMIGVSSHLFNIMVDEARIKIQQMYAALKGRMNSVLAFLWEHKHKLLFGLGLIVTGVAAMYGPTIIAQLKSCFVAGVCAGGLFRSSSASHEEETPQPQPLLLNRDRLVNQGAGISEAGAQFKPKSKKEKKNNRAQMKDAFRDQMFTSVLDDDYFVNNESEDAGLTMKFCNNVCTLDAGVLKINCTALGGRTVVTARHYLDQMVYLAKKQNNLKINVLIASVPAVTIDWSRVRVMRPKSFSTLALLTFPKNIPQFSNIIKHIISEKEAQYVSPADTYLLEKINSVNFITNVTTRACPSIDIAADQFTPANTLSDCYTYNYGRKGACGSPLVSRSPYPRIIGIHVAGRDGRHGYSEPIRREQFDHILEAENHGMVVEDTLSFPAVSDDHQKVSLDGTFIYCKTINDAFEVRMPTQTNIVKSLMYDTIPEIPVEVEPAPLCHKDERVAHFELSPLEAGIAKDGIPPLPFNTDVMEEAKRDLSEKLLAVCTPVTVELGSSLLTDQEVYAGIPGLKYAKSIERSSSEGLPLQLYRPPGAKGKAWCFNDGKDQFVDETLLEFKNYHPYLEKLHNDNMKLRKKGIVPTVIYNACLKDCLLPLAKCRKEGGTRVFSCASLENIIAMKKYFGKFQWAYSHNRPKSECSVGINADSREWTTLYQYLNEIPEGNYVTGDYKNFGGRLDFESISNAFDIICMWYDKYYPDEDPSDKKVRKLLCEELLNATHQAVNVQYKRFCGIPSGFALTVEINSLVNCLYMRMAWLSIGYTMENFNVHARLITYGDDLVMKVASKFPDFNFTTIKQFLSNHNIEFTPASKDANCVQPYTPSDEVTFLKRDFIRHPSRPDVILGRLPLASALSQINYCREVSNANKEELLYASCRQTLNLLHAHGPTVYEKYRKIFMDWWSNYNGEHFRHKTWQELDYELFNE